MREPGALRPAPLPPLARVALVERCSAAEFRHLYADVGARYHWTDRLAWSDDELTAYLDHPDVQLWLLYLADDLAGFFELRQHREAGARSVEIVYFGLRARFIGRGLGKGMLTAAVDAAWALGPDRVWLHTCTLDDPAALPNYLRRGFTPYREEHYLK